MKLLSQSGLVHQLRRDVPSVQIRSVVRKRPHRTGPSFGIVLGRFAQLNRRFRGQREMCRRTVLKRGELRGDAHAAREGNFLGGK